MSMLVCVGCRRPTAHFSHNQTASIQCTSFPSWLVADRNHIEATHHGAFLYLLRTGNGNAITNETTCMKIPISQGLVLCHITSCVSVVGRPIHPYPFHIYILFWIKVNAIRSRLKTHARMCVRILVDRWQKSSSNSNSNDKHDVILRRLYQRDFIAIWKKRQWRLRNLSDCHYCRMYEWNVRNQKQSSVMCWC